MKKLLRIGLLALIILIAAYSLYLFTGNKTETVVDAHVHSYACPMHCEGEKVYDRPGSCPVCNMDLVRIELKEKDKDASVDPLVEPTDSFVAGEFKTLTAQDTVLISEITLPGIVTFNPDASVNIAARVSGRIEKLYVNYKYQKVSKGQKIFDVYSPELLTEQQNYIYLISNDPGNTSSDPISETEIDAVRHERSTNKGPFRNKKNQSPYCCFQSCRGNHYRYGKYEYSRRRYEYPSGNRAVIS